MSDYELIKTLWDRGFYTDPAQIYQFVIRGKITEEEYQSIING
jgi:uncharacterized XkdX family phage protein